MARAEWLLPARGLGTERLLGETGGLQAPYTSRRRAFRNPF